MRQDLFLKRAIDPDASVDLEDSARTKLALKARGYLDAADGSLDEYPDRAMYDGIRKFQKDHGLAVDGVMKPGGPTETKLTGIMDDTEISTSPERPAKPCRGTWTLNSKNCIGDYCIFVWKCLAPPVGGILG